MFLYLPLVTLQSWQLTGKIADLKKIVQGENIKLAKSNNLRIENSDLQAEILQAYIRDWNFNYKFQKFLRKL